VTLQKEIVSETCNVSIVGVGGGQPPTRTPTCRYDEIGPITVPSIGVEGGF
jgi:hypothetical protein